jgi:tetratricopeptide (TPR) repeat protein
MRRGFVLMNEADLPAARKEAQLAMYDVERLQGTIESTAGNFDSAQAHFHQALRIAEAASDKDKIARAHMMLSMNVGQQARLDDARVHAETAMAHFAEIGDRLQLEGMRAELAAMYLNVRRFEEVIEPSEKALRFFERIKHDQWLSHICANLAEAYMETGRLEEAKEMAFRVLRMEVAPARPYALYTLGHVHDREGNPAHAATSFAEGIETARANSDPFIEAYLARALGTLLARNGRAADGLAHLEASLRLFTEMGLRHEVSATEAALQAARPS